MDNLEEEQSFEYFTTQNEDEDFITIPDPLSLPLLPEENGLNNKQIFYLTFNNCEENSEEPEVVETVTTSDSLNDNNSLIFDNTNVKIITLDDGRVFMTTGEDTLDEFQSPMLITGEEPEITEDVSTQIFNEEESLDNSDTNFQLLELEDGTQTLVALYKINNEVPKEPEPPKKVKRFQCTHSGCDKVYGTSYHLTVHMRSHTDYKPYQCVMEGCSKRFSTNYSLKAHVRTHTGETPYACQNCTKQFKTSGDLQKHIRTHTGEKPFECPVEGCGKSFTTSNIRKVHIRSHTGERPYSCSYPDCGKAFTSSTNYKNHLRIHSGEKPYVCNVEGCGKRFTEYSSLYKHNAVHQPNRPHACIFCGQNFKQESNLNFHKRIKHNVVVAKDGTEIIFKIE